MLNIRLNILSQWSNNPNFGGCSVEKNPEVTKTILFVDGKPKVVFYGNCQRCDVCLHGYDCKKRGYVNGFVGVTPIDEVYPNASAFMIIKLKFLLS